MEASSGCAQGWTGPSLQNLGPPFSSPLGEVEGLVCFFYGSVLAENVFNITGAFEQTSEAGYHGKEQCFKQLFFLKWNIFYLTPHLSYSTSTYNTWYKKPTCQHRCVAFLVKWQSCSKEKSKIACSSWRQIAVLHFKSRQQLQSQSRTLDSTTGWEMSKRFNIQLPLTCYMLANSS